MATSPPSISVIVPAYNAAGSVARCLKSLTDQDIQDIEIVVVDDGSTDDTAQTIRDASSADARIKPVLLPQNGGVHDARRAGMAAAQGRYIGFVDADDYVAPNMYSTLLGRMVSAGSPIGICAANLVADGRVVGPRIHFRSSRVVRTDPLGKFCRFKLGPGWLCNKLYAREVIEEPLLADLKLIAGEDYVVNVGAFHAASSVVLCRERLYYYVVHGANASGASGWSAFARLFRAYAVCLETYVPTHPDMASNIDELFIKQLYFPAYKVPETDPTEETVRHLAESLRRMTEANPRSIFNIVHSVPLWHARLRRVRAAIARLRG